MEQEFNQLATEKRQLEFRVNKYDELLADNLSIGDEKIREEMNKIVLRNGELEAQLEEMENTVEYQNAVELQEENNQLLQEVSTLTKTLQKFNRAQVQSKSKCI